MILIWSLYAFLVVMMLLTLRLSVTLTVAGLLAYLIVAYA